MASALSTIHQAAAIPIRNGRVCLVTSRGGKRWVIPKGCLEPGKTVGQIALQEAWEEAGLLGVLQRQPVGSYLYEKLGNAYHVTVFLMDVTESKAEWPECLERQRLWLLPMVAVNRVDYLGLRKLLRNVLAAEIMPLPTA
jgi:8-oxo-dGTP pyrophosphatase MutT (NUDIX family)